MGLGQSCKESCKQSYKYCDDIINTTTPKNTRDRTPRTPINTEPEINTEASESGALSMFMNRTTMEAVMSFEDKMTPKHPQLANWSSDEVILAQNRSTTHSIHSLHSLSPKVYQTPQHHVTTHDMNINNENKRLKSMSEAKSMEELTDTVRTVYFIETEYGKSSGNEERESSDNEGSSESAMDSEDKQRIEDLKIETPVPVPASPSHPNVYRQGTPNDWEEDDIAHLHNEMSAQFLNLSQQASERHGFGHIDDDEEDAYDDEDLPESNLFRDASADKWRDSIITKETQEMRKHLLHLATASSVSVLHSYPQQRADNY